MDPVGEVDRPLGADGEEQPLPRGGRRQYRLGWSTGKRHDAGVGVLTADQLAAYQRDGFVRLEEAFPRSLAFRCGNILWDQLDEVRDDPRTWCRPVVRLGSQTDPVFSAAAQSRRWIAAIHEIAGPLADPTPWMGGTFAVRFPVDADPGDAGWHVEGSFMGEDGWWWTNYWSRERAMLMLVLLSDVGADDAPTRLRVGSQRYIRDALAPFGDKGVNQQHVTLPDAVHACPLDHAVGRAGDVYLCHPFLVHAAQRHRGHVPRFIAQPGVPWKAGGRLS